MPWCASALPSILPDQAHTHADECFILPWLGLPQVQALLLPSRSCNLARVFSKFPTRIILSSKSDMCQWMSQTCFAWSVLSQGLCMCRQVLQSYPTRPPQSPSSCEWNVLRVTPQRPPTHFRFQMQNLCGLIFTWSGAEKTWFDSKLSLTC